MNAENVGSVFENRAIKTVMDSTQIPEYRPKRKTNAYMCNHLGQPHYQGAPFSHSWMMLAPLGLFEFPGFSEPPIAASRRGLSPQTSYNDPFAELTKQVELYSTIGEPWGNQ
jgi:hypothetical protein